MIKKFEVFWASLNSFALIALKISIGFHSANTKDSARFKLKTFNQISFFTNQLAYTTEKYAVRVTLNILIDKSVWYTLYYRHYCSSRKYQNFIRELKWINYSAKINPHII